MSDERARVLLVDDEPMVLDGLRRHLRRDFELATETSSEAALRRLEAGERFEVVVSDLRMPRLDGIGFLSGVHRVAPDVSRILLTGNADLNAAIAAVNSGAVFRFLTKPCPQDVLQPAVEAGVEQHRLRTAERELLERTLHGCVRMLVDVLALVSPDGFGHANRVRRRVGAVARHVGCADAWKLELAAMLAQAAFVSLPGDLPGRYLRREPLSADETAMVARVPGLAGELLAGVPRLGDVRAILRYFQKHYDGAGEPADDVLGDDLPIGARILKAVLDFDALEEQELAEDAVLETLRRREGWYDPVVLAALATPESAAEACVLSVSVGELREGMLLLDPIETSDGRLLVRRGYEVSIGLIERLHNFASNVGVKEPIRVQVPAGTLAEPVAAAR